MEKLIELPYQVAKKVMDFHKKFRENPRSAAIHLEPIHNFRDQRLRTARIDHKYRAIIGATETGDIYFLLWVDNHDEAMDWAKNKVFEWNDATQTAQIFTSVEQPPVAEAAEKEHTLFHNITDGQLRQIGVPDILMGLVRSLLHPRDLEEAESYLPVEVFERLYYLSEGVRIEQIIAEVEAGKRDSDTLDEQISSINNKRSFVEVSDDLMEEIINGDLSKWQVFLHPSQRQLVESQYKGSVKVTGGAGTGKTVVALHRLKYLSENRESSTQKILFTTYTNALTTNLVQLAQKLHIDSSRVRITNIDALLRELSQAAGIITRNTRILDINQSISSLNVWNEILEEHPSQFDATFLHGEYQNVILYNDVQDMSTYLLTGRAGRGKPLSRKQRMDVWTLVEAYNTYKQTQNLVDRSELFNKATRHFRQAPTKPFRHIIADEIQDFSNIELRFLRSLAAENTNDLFLVGDPFQNIYTRKLNFTRAGVSVRGNRSRRLRINYRTSEEIKRLAMSTVAGINYDDFDGEQEQLNGYLSLFHGEKPVYQLFRSSEDELQYIVDKMQAFRQQGLQYQDMAVGFRTRDALRDLKSRLHALEIPYTDTTTNTTTSSDAVTLSTFHSLKGLEFKVVFLAGINSRTCPFLHRGYHELEANEKIDYENSEKSLLYVAMTRAVQWLGISGTGMKSGLVGL